MAAKSTIVRVSSDLAIPALAMIALGILPIVNYMAGGGLMPHGLIYLVIRLIVIGAAGFVVTYRTKLGIGAAAIAGAAMFLLEQLVNVVWFVINWHPASILGVAQGYAVFVAGAVIAGAIGGVLGRTWSKLANAAI